MARPLRFALTGLTGAQVLAALAALAPLEGGGPLELDAALEDAAPAPDVDAGAAEAEDAAPDVDEGAAEADVDGGAWDELAEGA